MSIETMEDFVVVEICYQYRVDSFFFVVLQSITFVILIVQVMVAICARAEGNCKEISFSTQ